jgi:hypothetical protein
MKTGGEAGQNQKNDRWQRLLFVIGIVAAFAFAALLQYSAFKRGLYTKSADESVRTLAAYRWSQDGFSIPLEAWLPGYQMLVGLGLKAWPDLMIMPRVLNNILGLLTLGALGWLAWILFKNRWASLLTLVLGAAFGPRIVCSVVPFSGILFAFLMIMGIALFARWIDSRAPGLLLAAAGFTALAAAVRYEGWLFVAGMGFLSLYIILKQDDGAARNRRSLAVCACLLLCAIPVAWVVLLVVNHLDIRDLFTTSGRIYAGTTSNAHALQTLWNHGAFFQFFVQNLESLNIIGFSGAISFWICAQKFRKWLCLPLFAFVALSLLALAGVAVPAHNYWRPSLVWSLLLIPFCALWIIEQGKLLGRSRRHAGMVVCLLFASIFLFAFHRQTVKMTIYSNMDRADINVAKFVRSYITNLPKNREPRLFIEWAGWHFAHVRVASQCPDAFVNIHWVGRILKRNRLNLAKLRRNNVVLLIVELNTFYTRRPVFGDLKPAYKNVRWVVLPVEPEAEES